MKKKPKCLWEDFIMLTTQTSKATKRSTTVVLNLPTAATL